MYDYYQIHVCLYIMYVSSAGGGFGTEWHPVVSCPVGSRIELGSSGIAVSTFSHWAIPLAPVIICCLRFEDVQSFLDCDTSFSEYVLNMLFIPNHLFSGSVTTGVGVYKFSEILFYRFKNSLRWKCWDHCERFCFSPTLYPQT